MNGILVDGDTELPIAGAMVEIWQACESGKYNHPRDPNSAQLDPHFQYWAQVITDDRGAFSFKTIIPGAYPATETWMRPPHIHVKVHKRGYKTLTTQMYFAGHPLNQQDEILQDLSPSDRKLVTVEFKQTGNVKVGVWQIAIGNKSPLNPTEEKVLYTPEIE